MPKGEIIGGFAVKGDSWRICGHMENKSECDMVFIDGNIVPSMI